MVKKSEKSKLKLIELSLLVLAVLILMVVAALESINYYQQHHIYSSYGPNKTGHIIFKKQLRPKDWDYSTDNGATNAYSETLARSIPGQPYSDYQTVTIQKVYKSSMKFSQAQTFEASLRNEKTQALKTAGYGINVLPASSVIVNINSKKVRLPTVEFSEYYTFRFEESDAFYVQDGYYIDIQRASTTMGDAHPNHALLMSQINYALRALSISDK